MNTRKMESVQLKKRRGGIDPAALAAASLSAAITTITQAGPYTALSTVVGVTVLFVILFYDIDPYRTQLQSIAYASVVGLTSTVAAGYPLELLMATGRVGNESAVTQNAAISVWICATLFFWTFDRWFKIKK